MITLPPKGFAPAWSKTGSHRVELTSNQELGQVKLAPREGVGAKLTE